MSPAEVAAANIVPCISYRDAIAAIEWLCLAFGFEQKVVYKDEEGVVAHAELTFGTGMVMVGSVRDTSYGRLLREPGKVGGVTQSTYVVTADADAAHERAVAAGAEVVLPLTDQDYGGRDFTCRDLEGHIWTFGTYDPGRSH